MPYLYRCGAVKAFPKPFGKCPNARFSGNHYYCQKKQNVAMGTDADGKPVIVAEYLPCLYQKKYRKEIA